MEGHIPVLKDAILTTFKNLTGFLIDGTFGGGGHSEALLEQNNNLTIIGLDIDPEAINRASILKEKYPKRFSFEAINFSQIESLGKTFDGILLDLGVSSFQLDNAQRGFSFRNEGPLDMRMNPQKGLSAQQFLQTASENQLIQAIKEFGEEPQWRSVVKNILAYRETNEWATTLQFADFLDKHTSLYRSKKPGVHPATRVFQGLRIAINDELGHLTKGLEAAFNTLKSKGILAVITFHSLEDRIVKQHFYEWCGRSLNRFDSQPRQLKKIQAELLSRKPIVATQEEIINNPRSRSAKLRILKKL